MGFVELEYEEAAKYIILNINNLHFTPTGRGVICEYSLEDH